MATVEEYLKEFKELTAHPDRIRNFCTSAHIHHGKCISGDSRLVLTDGRVISAKAVYELAQS